MYDKLCNLNATSLSSSKLETSIKINPLKLQKERLNSIKLDK